MDDRPTTRNLFSPPSLPPVRGSLRNVRPADRWCDGSSIFVILVTFGLSPAVAMSEVHLWNAQSWLLKEIRDHRSLPTLATLTEIFYFRILAIWTIARPPRTRNLIFTPRIARDEHNLPYPTRLLEDITTWIVLRTVTIPFVACVLCSYYRLLNQFCSIFHYQDAPKFESSWPVAATNRYCRNVDCVAR